MEIFKIIATAQEWYKMIHFWYHRQKSYLYHYAEGYRECRVARSQGYHHCIPIEPNDKEECQKLKCDQDCKNSKCSCGDGFELSDGTRCEVPNSESTILIVKDGTLKEKGKDGINTM